MCVLSIKVLIRKKILETYLMILIFLILWQSPGKYRIFHFPYSLLESAVSYHENKPGINFFN